jgi:hypothetical protein
LEKLCSRSASEGETPNPEPRTPNPELKQDPRLQELAAKMSQLVLASMLELTEQLPNPEITIEKAESSKSIPEQVGAVEEIAEPEVPALEVRIELNQSFLVATLEDCELEDYELDDRELNDREPLETEIDLPTANPSHRTFALAGTLVWESLKSLTESSLANLATVLQVELRDPESAEVLLTLDHPIDPLQPFQLSVELPPTRSTLLLGDLYLQIPSQRDPATFRSLATQAFTVTCPLEDLLSQMAYAQNLALEEASEAPESVAEIDLLNPIAFDQSLDLTIDENDFNPELALSNALSSDAIGNLFPSPLLPAADETPIPAALESMTTSSQGLSANIRANSANIATNTLALPTLVPSKVGTAESPDLFKPATLQVLPPQLDLKARGSSTSLQPSDAREFSTTSTLDLPGFIKSPKAKAESTPIVTGIVTGAPSSETIQESSPEAFLSETTPAKPSLDLPHFLKSPALAPKPSPEPILGESVPEEPIFEELILEESTPEALIPEALIPEASILEASIPGEPIVSLELTDLETATIDPELLEPLPENLVLALEEGLEATHSEPVQPVLDEEAIAADALTPLCAIEVEDSERVSFKALNLHDRFFSRLTELAEDHQAFLAEETEEALTVTLTEEMDEASPVTFALDSDTEEVLPVIFALDFDETDFDGDHSTHQVQLQALLEELQADPADPEVAEDLTLASDDESESLVWLDQLLEEEVENPHSATNLIEVEDLVPEEVLYSEAQTILPQRPCTIVSDQPLALDSESSTLEVSNPEQWSASWKTPPASAWAMEVVVPDERLDLHQRHWMAIPDDPTPQFPADEPLPLPQVSVPEGELVAGETVTIAVLLPDTSVPLCVKLWLVDCQVRSLASDPYWVTHFLATVPGHKEARLMIPIPHGCLDLQIEAITLEPATQRESHKVTVERSVIPARLPQFEMEDLEIWDYQMRSEFSQSLLLDLPTGIA